MLQAKIGHASAQNSCSALSVVDFLRLTNLSRQATPAGKELHKLVLPGQSGPTQAKQKVENTTKPNLFTSSNNPLVLVVAPLLAERLNACHVLPV